MLPLESLFQQEDICLLVVAEEILLAQVLQCALAVPMHLRIGILVRQKGTFEPQLNLVACGDRTS